MYAQHIPYHISHTYDVIFPTLNENPIVKATTNSNGLILKFMKTITL